MPKMVFTSQLICKSDLKILFHLFPVIGWKEIFEKQAFITVVWTPLVYRGVGIFEKKKPLVYRGVGIFEKTP